MKSFKTPLLIALLTGISVSTAFAHGDRDHGDDNIGKPGDAKKVTRTIHIAMTDAMRFTPANINAKQNETIRFVVTNKGKIKHELVLGTEKQLRDHNEVMKKNPEMEHEEPNEVSLAPGATGEMIWQFTKPGKITFACLQPGHFDAGMKGAVIVADRTGSVPSAMLKPSSSASANLVTPLASSSAAGATNGSRPQTAESKSSPKTAPMSEGEVRKIDKETGKITIKHGPLVNLEMPGMTMVFHVKNSAMLDQVKEGDKIKFMADKIGGVMTVMQIDTVK